MKRRDFLRSLLQSCCGCHACRSSLRGPHAEDEDHAGSCLLAAQSPTASLNQSDVGGHDRNRCRRYGHRRGRREGHVVPVRGQAHWSRSPNTSSRLWQDMNRAFFYPQVREKTDAIGALDMALWDIKGKVQGLPVHQLLDGMVRNYCECYNTAGVIPGVYARHGHQGSRQAHDGRRLSRLPVRRHGSARQYDLQYPRAHYPPAR